MRPKGMEDLAAFSVIEESSSRGKRRVFLCRRTVRVKVKSKVIPASFLKIEGRGTFVGAKEKRLVELGGDQNSGPKAPPRSKRGERDVRGGAIEKSRYVRVIEGKVRGDDQIEYFLSTGVESYFWRRKE